MRVNKLLIIIQKDLFGESIGGMHTFLKGLIKYKPDDFEIELVGITTNRKERPVGIWNNIEFSEKKIRFLPVLYIKDQNKRHLMPLSLSFEAALLKYKSKIPLVDRILEFHRPEPIFIFKKTSNQKVMYMHQNIMDLYNPFSEKKWSSMPWLYFKFESFVMPVINKVFVVSEKGVDFYKQKYPKIKDRFLFMPTWVDDNIFYPLNTIINKNAEFKKIIGDFDISDNTIVLLFAGRLEGQKNPLLLIDSFYKLYSKNKNIKLIIVGDGSLKGNVIERINKYDLQNNVRIVGILTQKQLAGLMRISDVFVITSAYEGMPRAVVEALASGIPVVSTDVGEARKVVKNGVSGILVKDHDPSVIAESVLEILNNKDIYNTENCTKAIENYKVVNIVNKIYDIYRYF